MWIEAEYLEIIKKLAISNEKIEMRNALQVRSIKVTTNKTFGLDAASKNKTNSIELYLLPSKLLSYLTY